MTMHLKVSDEVVESTIGDEVILLHLGSGQIFALDATGTLVWKHIRAKAPLESLQSLMAQIFEARPGQIDQDISAFLAELFQNKILIKM